MSAFMAVWRSVIEVVVDESNGGLVVEESDKEGVCVYNLSRGESQ